MAIDNGPDQAFDRTFKIMPATACPRSLGALRSRTLKHQLQSKLQLPRGCRRRNLPGRVVTGVDRVVA